MIRLHGGGEEGLGEDVTYDGELQTAQQEHGPTLPLAGSWTFDSFARMLDETRHVPGGRPRPPGVPQLPPWAFESAALDLALRQAGRSLADAVGREPRPITFVVSSRMGEPPTIAPVTRRLAAYPDLRFKLDGTPDWTDDLIDELVATRRRRLDRLQGRLQGHDGRHADLAGLLPRGSPRRSRTPGSRTPTSTRSPRARRCARSRTASPGTRRSTRSTTSSPRRCSRRPSTSSRRGSAACARCSPPTTSARSAAWAPTAAASTSSAWAAGRSSTWRRSSIPTRPTTSLPPATTRSTRSPGCPPSPLEPELDATGFRRRI